MTETRKESLSALIDGEASEIEVHRLVREFRSDETLSDSWAIYQHVRATIRKGDHGPQLTPDHHQTLLDRISDSVHAEAAHDHTPVKSAKSPVKAVVGSLALAASLVVAVFIGVQQPGDPASIATTTSTTQPQTFNNSTQPVSSTPQAFTSQPQAFTSQPQPQAFDARTVSNTDTLSPTSELIELDEEKQRRLRAYLNQHDRMVRMNDNSQLVNFKKAPGK